MREHHDVRSDTRSVAIQVVAQRVDATDAVTCALRPDGVSAIAVPDDVRSLLERYRASEIQ